MTIVLNLLPTFFQFFSAFHLRVFLGFFVWFCFRVCFLVFFLVVFVLLCFFSALIGRHICSASARFVCSHLQRFNSGFYFYSSFHPSFLLIHSFIPSLVLLFRHFFIYLFSQISFNSAHVTNGLRYFCSVFNQFYRKTQIKIH